MYWFIHANRAPDARRSQQTQRADDCSRLVGKNVAEHILGKEHVEIRWPHDQQHGRCINIHVRELDVAVILANPCDHFAPQPRALQHVALIHGNQLVAAGPGKLKGHARNALNLRFAIAHGVCSNTRACGTLN